jgi:hypothetical protein
MIMVSLNTLQIKSKIVPMLYNTILDVIQRHVYLKPRRFGDWILHPSSGELT